MRVGKHIKLPTIPTIWLVILLLTGAVIWTGCDFMPWTDNGGETPPQQPQPPDDNAQPPQPDPLPDLMISAIEVFPAQPQSGQHFTLNVYVRNAGQAPSGAYDLAIFIRDVSRGSTYPVGTFRKDGLHPGDNVAAYGSADRLVNDPGSYQVHVEIAPWQSKDGNEQNNVTIWAFTVK